MLSYAIPNALSILSTLNTLSQRGRFHGWKMEDDAGVEGLWLVEAGDETEMQKQHKKRSLFDATEPVKAVMAGV